MIVPNAGEPWAPCPGPCSGGGAAARLPVGRLAAGAANEVALAAHAEKAELRAWMLDHASFTVTCFLCMLLGPHFAASTCLNVITYLPSLIGRVSRSNRGARADARDAV